MKTAIVLDSGPLGLIVQQRDKSNSGRCRDWLKRILASGARVYVPEIINFELRRELIRLGKTGALTHLKSFNAAVAGRYLPITSAALDLAAELWAKARRQGKPTADPHALDIDVILAAQVIVAGFDLTDVVVATSNVSHLAMFLPAQTWETI